MCKWALDAGGVACHPPGVLSPASIGSDVPAVHWLNISRKIAIAYYCCCLTALLLIKAAVCSCIKTPPPCCLFLFENRDFVCEGSARSTMGYILEILPAPPLIYANKC